MYGETAPNLNKSISISIRKIDNGWIVSESYWQGDEYKSKEYFSETEPELGYKENKLIELDFDGEF